MSDVANSLGVAPIRNRRARRGSSHGYVAGLANASAYMGWCDKQARTFKDWARDEKIPFALIGGRAVYRIADLDAAWERVAKKTMEEALA